MAYDYYNFDIPQLRQQEMFNSYGSQFEPYQFQEQAPIQQFQQFQPPELNPNLFAQRDWFEPSSTSAVSAPSQTGMSRSTNEVIGDPLANSKRIFDAIGKVYSPETGSMDRYNELLDNFPERNEPGWGRKLVAGTLGWTAGGNDPIGTMEKIMYAPYLRDAAEWQAKTTPFKDAATLENTQNANERVLAGNVLTAQNTMERNDQLQRQAMVKAEETERSNRANEAIKDIRERALAWKNTHPDWKIMKVGSRMISYSPDGKQQLDLGASGDMDAHTAAVLGLNLDIAKIQAQNDANVILKQTPAGTGAGGTRAGAGGPDLAQQEAIQQKKMEILDSDPRYSGFIQKDAEGKYYITEEPQWGFMPWNWNVDEERENHQNLRRAVYGADAAGPPPPRPQEAAPPLPLSPGASNGLGPSPDVLRQEMEARIAGAPQQTNPYELSQPQSVGGGNPPQGRMISPAGAEMNRPTYRLFGPGYAESQLTNDPDEMAPQQVADPNDIEWARASGMRYNPQPQQPPPPGMIKDPYQLEAEARIAAGVGLRGVDSKGNFAYVPNTPQGIEEARQLGVTIMR